MWVVAANPGCIIQLVTQAADAWVETAKQGKGLFSGAQMTPQYGEQVGVDVKESAHLTTTWALT
jgi:hypothetical protein